MSRQIIIVGPSGSGKTTVAQAIARELGLPLISMDDFRIRKSNKVLFTARAGTQEVRSWENPGCWDGNAISSKLRAAHQLGVGYVAEGNHLLMYSGIAALDAERYYLHVPFKVSLQRRKTRHRFLPADESFKLIGESETLRWVAPQQDLPNVVLVDGDNPTYTLVQQILRMR